MTDEPAKVGPSNWLSIVKDVFPRWRDRLGSKEAASELEALLRSVPSLKLQVKFTLNADGSWNGEEIRSVTSPEFWKSSAYLLVQTEVDGTDHLKVHYKEYDPSLSDGEFFVRRYDVKRWERLYFPTPAAPPPASQTAADQQLEDKTGNGPVETGASHPPAAPPGGDPPKHVDTKTWITAAAIRLKKDNEIPPDAYQYVSHFAKLLAKRMEKAAETNKKIHPVGWPHIKNNLSDWGLWPIESIKTS